ncbi:ribonuclease H-like YkuK family protein [Candidatus Gottesmanbacteria bacterium]|nr:ribonuclease H-like YkuK family protein [Candidatus Gottesmanbacteria bacterium]
MKGNGHFNSATYGVLDLDGVRAKVLLFLKKEPNRQYRLIVGTDSEPKNGQGTEFISAIVVHRVGSGGIYFWRRNHDKKKYVLRTRMYQEATLSLTLADELLHLFKNDGIGRFDVEIHVDIGHTGETRTLITEIVGMIRGSGFPVKTKPDSYAASKVADRHT